MIPQHTAELLQITAARQHIDNAACIAESIATNGTHAQQQRIDLALRAMSRVRSALHHAEQAAQTQEYAR